MAVEFQLGEIEHLVEPGPIPPGLHQDPVETQGSPGPGNPEVIQGSLVMALSGMVAVQEGQHGPDPYIQERIERVSPTTPAGTQELMVDVREHETFPVQVAQQIPGQYLRGGLFVRRLFVGNTVTVESQGDGFLGVQLVVQAKLPVPLVQSLVDPALQVNQIFEVGGAS